MIIIAACLVIVIGFVAWFVLRKKNPESYRTATAVKGDITSAIAASGTVEPEEVIDVGAQVAGRIVRFGLDKAGKPIDYGSQIEEGMILAYIDDATYKSDLTQATAQYDQSQAGVAKAQADLDQTKAKLYQAEREWKRAQELGPSDALSQSDFDIAQSNYETAKANVQVSRAAIRQAELSVVQSQALVERARQNLSYCIIHSPIRGIIIDRRVNIGQTVVASLSAPSLFLIAKDLRRIQIWVPVNEADIGHIRTGQAVEFTVDAHPGMSFKGQVAKVRLNATMTQNVVTYTVVVNTENPDGKLLPYLTANVKFVMEKKSNVIYIPNAALAWTPPGRSNTPKKEIVEEPGKEAFNAVVWVLQDKKPKRVPVKTGLSDGSVTEVQGLTEGMNVITGVEEAAPEAAEVNPFTPKLPSRRR
ncbi:MAG: efflux RND transporter periplasmic adaptor subunit [Spirochaetia bacterium]|nr:efflux RND transporter periplasmic adaptor subunit [Spirochaetia bacterium]